VTEHGGLYTWGEGTLEEDDDNEEDEEDEEENDVPLGLGYGDRERKLVPTRVAPALLQGASVGRCRELPPLHASHSPWAIIPGWAALYLLLLATARTVSICQCRGSWCSA